MTGCSRDWGKRLFPPGRFGTGLRATSRLCRSRAVAGDSQSKFVFIADDEDRARRVEISPGDERDGRTEVVAGLSGIERVVLEPPARLASDRGDLVKVVE